MSSPTLSEIFRSGESALLMQRPYSYTDDGLNDSLDGSSAELTDVFEEDCWEGEVWSPPLADLQLKIGMQLENYLSNENLSSDAFLLKHIQRNKLGYVSLKLLTSFKKIRELTRDWRTTLAAARSSPLLEVNEEGTKVRRMNPVPDWLLCIPTSKLLLAWNLHGKGDSAKEAEDQDSGAPSPGAEHQGVMETAMHLFGCHGPITSLRVLRPGKEVPDELKRYAKKHPELGRKVCAVVEYEYLDGARRAYEALRTEELQQQGGKGVRVVLLGSRGTRKPSSGSASGGENVADDASSEGGTETAESKKTSRTKTKRYPYSLEDSALYSSSEYDFAPASPRPNRRVSRPQAQYGSPLGIPRASSVHGDPYRNPLGCSVGSPLLPRKLFPAGGHATSPLATPLFSSTPTSVVSSNYTRNKCFGDFSHDGLAGSPWVQRRKQATQSYHPEKGSSSPCQAKRSAAGVRVLRQPMGPDGTKGFHNCIGRGKVLLPQ